MAENTWEYDVASGIGKNHSISKNLRMAAVSAAKIMPFVKTESGYGKNAGETLNIFRIPNIAEPTTGQITESERLPIDTFSQSVRSVTVSEWGRGVEYTHKSQLLSHYSREDAIQKKLRQQMTLVLDTAAAVAFKAGQINFCPTSLANGTFDTDGTASTTALVNGSVAHCKVIRDYLLDTLHCPGYDGSDRFMCIASVKFLRGIRNDPEFLAFKQGTQAAADAFERAVVGSIENIDFVEVAHTQALSNSKGSGGILGEAVFFGDDAVTMAIAEDPELRDAIPGDFGRSRAVGWYGVLGFLNVWGDSASDGQAKTICVTSA